MIAPYPKADESLLDEAAERDFALVRELISGIRNVRNEYKVEPARWVAATVVAGARAPLLSDQRALIVLHFYLGLPLQETSEVLGIPVGTAKSRLFRATAQMRAAIDADARLPLAAGRST